MHRVEGVEAVLEGFAASALFSIVKPDWDQGQNGESLGRKIICKRTQTYRDGHSLEHDDVQKYHGSKLSQTCERKVPEQIKENHGQNTHGAVIHEAHHRKQQAAGYDEEGLEDGFCTEILPCGIQSTDGKKSQKQREHDVLMEWIDHAATVQQIERDLGNESENEKPQGVFPKIGCMKIAF